MAVVGLAMIAVGVFAFTGGGGVADAAPITGGNITAVCTGTTSGTTFTLTADCGEVTTSLTVPAGITTVDGGGHTISATDLNGADPTVHTPIPQWNGGIVTNTPGQAMNIRNVTITGPAAGFSLCNNSGYVLYGIYFNGAAGGSVSNVTVDHLFQFQNNAFGSCQTGRAIRADDSGTITITGTTVRDYQKSGFEARGSTTMNVSGSTAGPSHPLEALIAQNGVSFVGAAGTVNNNTIFGSGHTQTVGGPGASTAVLLFGAHDVTVTNNTLTSPAAPRPGTDIGISVSAGSSTDIVIRFNKVNRLGPDVPDDVGIGIDVNTPDGSRATLHCNTFSKWKINVVGAEQIECTPLPRGNLCQAYSAPAPDVDSGKNYGPTRPNPPIVDARPFTWTVQSGRLPPGLELSSAGAITGTPTEAGTFLFTMKLVDSTGLTATQAKAITIAPDGCPAVDKEADSPTVTAGGLAGYRITVTNRSRRHTARNLWICDRIPRNMTFVRATRRLRVFRGMRCLVIARLLPRRSTSFHLTLRVAFNANATETNAAEVIPGPPETPGTKPPVVTKPIAKAKPIARVKAKVKVRNRRPPFTG
ncbi:MAG TPA: putative Ig domain-containing protein [Gaiellaceae bacterium]|nr:putative Ig domain-containing protein [Gaiellaceae bacterium]